MIGYDHLKETPSTWQNAKRSKPAKMTCVCMLLQDVDITQVMTKRMNAVKKLQKNPRDIQALGTMYRAQKEVCETTLQYLLSTIDGGLQGASNSFSCSQQTQIEARTFSQKWFLLNHLVHLSEIS